MRLVRAIDIKAHKDEALKAIGRRLRIGRRTRDSVLSTALTARSARNAVWLCVTVSGVRQGRIRSIARSALSFECGLMGLECRRTGDLVDFKTLVAPTVAVDQCRGARGVLGNIADRVEQTVLR
jgi:hypothetical protein